MSSIEIYRKLCGLPLGRHLFSWFVCWKAPYFASVCPVIETLEVGACDVSMKHRRRVSNHLGSIHAIAMCNIAELSAGLMTDASLASGLRWIPKAMTVEYLKKAKGPILAQARSTTPFALGENFVDVHIRDQNDNEVFKAKITMHISEKKERV